MIGHCFYRFNNFNEDECIVASPTVKVVLLMPSLNVQIAPDRGRYVRLTKKLPILIILLEVPEK